MELDLETRVLNARKKLEASREDKARLEERLANATRQRDDIEKQLKAVGIDPANLDAIIKSKTEELEAKVAKFEADTEKLADSLQAIQENLSEAN